MIFPMDLGKVMVIHDSWMRTGAPLRTLGSESINIFGVLESVCIYILLYYNNFMCHFV